MSQDTVLHRLVRPLVRPLAHTVVQPDHLTMLRAATGVAAAALFLHGGGGAVGAGAGLLLLSCLLDRADGELARVSQRFSANGRRWDLVADCGVDALVFLGLGIGARGRLAGWGPLLGVSAALAVALLFRQLNATGPATPSRPARRVAIDPDDAMLAVPLLLWAAGPVPVVLLAGILTPAAALGVWVAARRRR